MVFDYQPRLTEKEFDEYMSSYHDLIISRRSGSLSQENYVRKKEQLDANFHSKINPLDERIFPDIKGLNELLTQTISPKLAEKNIEHELEHGREAESLGYSVQYGAWLMQGYSGDLIVVPFTHVREESSSSSLDQIKNVTTFLSQYDRL